MKSPLNAAEEQILERFARRLVDQVAARILIPALKESTGFWFGGGNMIEDADGNLFLVGRFRNAGDSRTGLYMGERGLELAIFRSEDRGQSFQKFISFSKSDLDVADKTVLSIEGSALHWTKTGVELFVSTEKRGIGYPPGWESYLKPGAGVWTIDHLQSDTIEGLKHAPLRTILQSSEPSFLHLKDPFVHDGSDGDVSLFCCTHPYCWSSSNTAVAQRWQEGVDFKSLNYDFFPRGFAWDVAITRGTCVVDVPPIGPFADRSVSLVFYDGGESLRNLDEHRAAVHRSRGYSCEEIGGVAYVVDGNWTGIKRLSRDCAWFISPCGTGCSRYVDVHVSRDGYYVTWQQSQDNLSQPLVMNIVPHEAIQALFN